MIIKPFIITILVMHHPTSTEGESHLFPDATTPSYTMTLSQCRNILFDVAYTLIERNTPPVIMKCEKLETYYYGKK